MRFQKLENKANRVRITPVVTTICFYYTTSQRSHTPYKWVKDVPTDTSKLYLHLCIMRYLVNIIAPENSFSVKLQALLKKYPSVDPKAIGLQVSWTKEPLWN